MPPWSQARKGSPEEPESPAQPAAAPQARWLSQGWESVLHGLRSGELPPDEAGCHCDVLILGSGYGGAMAAAELAGSRLPDGRLARVWVLERGQERLPGSFPSELGELPGHVRISRAGHSGVSGRRDGLFDLRIQPDVCALVGNGLGGGSLINAGVMDWPDAAVFAQAHWPAAIRAEQAELAQQAGEIAQRLGARVAGQPNGVASAGCAPQRFRAFEALSGPGTLREAPITVALKPQASGDGVQLDACLHCGDCATGCNHNAKVSLDTNLLARARRLGARVVTGATACQLSPAADAWDVAVAHTDEQAQRREGRPHTLRTRRVIVAAGTLGSTELLLRSRSAGLPLSPRLGERFSGNGDMIAVLHDVHDQHGQGVQVNGVADESSAPLSRGVGPTITGILEQKQAGDLPHVVEDLAIPGPLRRLFEEVFQTAHALHTLDEADRSEHTGQAEEPDPLAPSQAVTRRSMAVALIGHDDADGWLRLRPAAQDPTTADGQLDIAWPTLRQDPRFEARQRALQAHCEQRGWRTRVLPNPAWRPLPDTLEDLFGRQRGPLLTVHPLGGCAMGDDATCGVVNNLGEVFDPRVDGGRGVHAGLIVLDGAIVPGSLGTNPALTIATLAHRGVTRLRERWGWQPADAAPGPLRQRPRLRTMPDPVPHERTRVELGERLRGWWGDTGIELTLRFGPQDLQALVRGEPGARTLRVSPGHSEVRRVRRAPQAEVDALGGDPWHDAFTIDRQALQGSLRVLHREPSGPLRRTARGLWAWWLNRGWRDVGQQVVERLRGEHPDARSTRPLLADLARRTRGAWRLASHAGEVRRFDYDLQVIGDGPWSGQRLCGHKRLTFNVAANPWHQLMSVTLTQVPGLRRRAPGPQLQLDLAHLAQEGLALMRVSHQHHLPDTWVELIGLGLWVARVLLHTHAWSLRLPDAPRPGPIDRLPRSTPSASTGMPPHEVTELSVAPDLADGTPVRLRLSRLRGRTAQAQPIVLLHGYSAGGTTFLHPSVPQGLARTLWDAGFDVWVADLRTSPGLPTATHPWSFDDVAHHDIPIAIDHIWRHTGERPIDVFAHCMGSAMLWTGLLGEPKPGDNEHEALRLLMPERIRRIGMSQVAPLVNFAPDNLFRAFVARHALALLPQGPFHFRPPSQTSFADTLLDRLLSTLPYPRDEWRRENPLWPPAARTPWAGSRHRMDLLYGRDFKLATLPQSVLDDIDEHFGPLNLGTLTQALHMARAGGLASPEGQARGLPPERLAKVLQRTPVMGLHGRDNALSSVTGLLRFRALVDELGPELATRFTHHVIEGHGHQDCLIGVHAPQVVFPLVLDFFQREAPAGHSPASGGPAPVPWVPKVRPVPLGPFLGTAFSSANWQGGAPHWPLNIGHDPAEPEPALVACVPRRPGGQLGEPHLLPWPAQRPSQPLPTSVMRTLALPAAWWPGPGHALGVFLVQGPKRTPNQAERDRIVAAVLAAAGSSTPTTPGHPTSLGEGHVDAPWWVPCPPQACLADALASPSTGTPQPADSAWVLALGSCLYPGSLAERTPGAADWQAGPPDQAWQGLVRWRAQPGHPPLELAILSGDQVYADATAGLFDPRTVSGRFHQPHQAMLTQRLLRQALAGVPVHTLIDDHEIVDNWSWQDSDHRPADAPWHDNRQRRTDGLRAYRQHQRFAQPVRHPVDPRDPTSQPARLWYAFTHRSLPFFVTDTRTQREPRAIARFEQAHIMGRAQWACLLHWLAHHGPDDRPTFVASPSILLPRRLLSDTLCPASAALADAWEAYPRSLHALLAHLCRTQARHVVFLSGDEHLSCIARVRIRREGDGPEREVLAHSVHSSALYAPYPFANSRPHDFRAQDAFTFTDRHEGRLEHFHCRIETDFAPPGDGLALIETRQGVGGGWHVNVAWQRENGLQHQVLF